MWTLQSLRSLGPKMIAIDFGTTNSSIAILAEGDTEPRIQRVEYGDPDSYNASVIPSAICDCKNHECRTHPETIGHEAVRHYFGSSHDASLFQEMKLHFDRTTLAPATFVETGEVTELREEGGFITPVRKTIKQAVYKGEVPLTPAEFVPSTASLIKNLIERVGGAEHRRNVVFGVPASFKQAGKRRLREAGKRAVAGEHGGYEGVQVYLEPLAAARAYMQLDRGNTLVLDYGGGTLDISVMAIEKGGKFDPRKVTFDGFSEGGSRMDEKLIEFCLDKGGPELAAWYEKQNLLVRRRVKRDIENAKIQLSLERTAEVEFPGSPVGAVELTGSDMALALQGITTRMAVKIAEVVIKAVGKIENIDFVVLSGGTSLNRVVQDGVLSIFRHIPPEKFIVPDPRKPDDVETCLCAVAKGLAWLRHDGFPPIDFGD